jgi:hypothetical protein
MTHESSDFLIILSTKKIPLVSRRKINQNLSHETNLLFIGLPSKSSSHETNLIHMVSSHKSK